MKRISTLVSASMAALALAACGPGNNNPDGGDASSPSDGSAPSDGASSAAIVGIFKVMIEQPSMTSTGATTVVGRVQDGETPSTVLWSQSMASGDCKLMTPSVPSCTPACGSSAACVATNTCARYPSGLDAGAITISGLRGTSGASPVTLTNVANNYQLPAGTTLMYPAFAEGEALSIQAAGVGSVPGFSLTNAGITPLAVTSNNLTVAANTALNLTWTPPAMTSDAQRIRVKLDISHHGGTRGMITCETADDGSLEIAAPLVTALVALGVAGFPSIVISRERTTSSTVGAGRATFSVVSDTEQFVTIPGVRSCSEDADCMGMGTCREDLTCG